MYRGVVSISHNFDYLYAMKRDAECVVDRNLPVFEETTQESDVHRPIGCMLDLFAMDCVKNDSLIKKVNLISFEMNGNVQGESLKKDIMGYKRLKKMFNEGFDFESLLNHMQTNVNPIQNSIYHLLDRRKYLGDLFPKVAHIKEQRIKIIEEQKVIKKRLPELNFRLAQAKNSLGINENNIEIFKQLTKIGTPYSILSINQLFVYQTYIRALVKVDDVELTTNQFLQYRNDLDIESIPKCDVIIHHRKNNKLSIPTFIEKVKAVSKRFGGVAELKFDYSNANSNDRFDKGRIGFTLLGGEFVIPFVGEIKKAIGFGSNVPLKVPYKIVPLCIRFRPIVIKAINEWIILHRLQLQQAGPMFIGSQDEVTKAMNLLLSNNATLRIPYKSFTIPGGISIAHVVSLVNKLNRSISDYNQRWAVDKQTDLQTRFLVVPTNVGEDTVKNFFRKIQKRTGEIVDKDEEILYDYIFCCGKEDAVLSGSKIPLFNQDGSFVCHNFCVSCAHDMILDAVKKLYDQEEAQPRMDLVIGNTEKIKTIPPTGTNLNEQWPYIPFGQFLWCLTAEPKLNAVARTWFSSIVYQTLHSYFEFCPDHPKILLRRKRNGILRCVHPGCQMYLCVDCKKWHKRGQCNEIPEVPMGFRVCPNCKRPVEKTQDCNHIECSCGKHFCYYCGYGPKDDKKDIYHHMGREHGGCFNDPPDYKRLKHEPVSDEEIEAFYNKYPKLKPLSYTTNRRRKRHLF